MEGGGPRRPGELVAGRKAGPAEEDASNSRRGGPPVPNGGGRVRGTPRGWAGRLRGEVARKSKWDSEPSGLILAWEAGGENALGGLREGLL